MRAPLSLWGPPSPGPPSLLACRTLDTARRATVSSACCMTLADCVSMSDAERHAAKDGTACARSRASFMVASPESVLSRFPRMRSVTWSAGSGGCTHASGTTRERRYMRTSAPFSRMSSSAFLGVARHVRYTSELHASMKDATPPSSATSGASCARADVACVCVCGRVYSPGTFACASPCCGAPAWPRAAAGSPRTCTRAASWRGARRGCPACARAATPRRGPGPRPPPARAPSSAGRTPSGSSQRSRAPRGSCPGGT